MSVQYIRTRYMGPTNYKGSRIKAYASWAKETVTVSYDCALNPDDNHRLAARKLAEKLEWSGEWWEGGAPDGNVYVNVKHDSEPAFTTEGKH